MTLPLRAYLMLRSGESDWSVTVCRDLDAVLEAWKGRPDTIGTTGILHIGFDRPPSQLFDDVASAFPGKMLLTTAAKHALPIGFESSIRSVGSVDGLSIHLAMKGWGYVVADDEPPEENDRPNVEEPATITDLGDWLVAFVERHPEAESAIRRRNISNDASYLLNESLLERDVRYQAGLFRYQILIASRSDDPCAILQAAPPWLLDRSIETIDLTVRASNVFVNLGVKTVRDLAGFTVEDLLGMPNFGRRSVDDWRDALIQALNEGPFDVNRKIEEANAIPLLLEIQRTLAAFDEREQDILTRRMGLGRASQTLQQIADDYKITRERVRQIEAKSLRRLVNSAFWGDLLIRKLDGLLLGREFPLPVLGVEALDSWFQGIGKSINVLKYLLPELCPDKLFIVRIEGVAYIGKLRQDDWENELGEARRILSNGSGQGWTQQYCRARVEGLLKEPVREFRNLLWQHAQKLCHFSDGPNETMVLASYGRGAEQIVEALLLESERPLHYSEIAERAAQRSGKPVDLRRAHNAAAVVGLLMGRGVYGLRHHIPLSDEDADAVRDQIEEAIVNGPDGRQWHASEIVSLLAERDQPVFANINKYVVDNLLKESSILQRLGRMTWMKALTASQGPNNRIDLRQAILAVVQNAGGPLATNEIKQRLVALRGVNESFQISANDPLVRVGTALWGINDRDTPLTRHEQGPLIERLVTILQNNGEGIHLSEAYDIIFAATHREIDPDIVFSIASSDRRLAVNIGQYLYLREWGSARRENVSNAVRITLEQADKPLSIEQIMAAVRTRIKRDCATQAVSSCLQAMEAKFEPSSSTWSYPAQSAVEDEEPAEANVA
jgi:hypothetical protein